MKIIYSDEFLDHDTGYYHPEKPGRLTAITAALQAAPWADRLTWQTPTPVDQNAQLWDALYAIHPPRYVDALRDFAIAGGGRVDADTVMSPRSFEVAVLAVSGWLDGVDAVLDTGEPVFVLARPPGHHALQTQSMGFCLFSNAAIAAHYALQKSGVDRVAILDWDVHHGNGTQAIVETNPQIIYCSLHEYPHYPGTGAAHERGKSNNILNFPMPAGSTVSDYQPLFAQQILPFLQNFQPDLLIVSAGYDANAADPLADINLQPEDFGLFTDYCLQVTPRIVFGLEGGYEFKTLGRSVVATIDRCLGVGG